METNTTDEIDLIELFIKFLRFLKRRLILILSIGVLGIGIGIGKYSLSEKYYETYLVGTSNTVDNTIIVDIINSLNLLIEDNNAESLSKKLDISTNIAMNIKNIQADTLSDSNFKITLQVYDNNLNRIRDGLLSSIRKNEYIYRRNIIKNKQTKELILKTVNEISNLKEFQLELLNFQKEDNKTKETIIINKDNEIQTISNEILSLYKQKQSLEKHLELNSEDIEVIEDFTEFKNPVDFRIRLLSIYGLSGLFIGFMLSMILDIRRKFL